MAGNPPASDALDAALADTFPASDPPAFMAASAVVGSPRRPPSRGRRTTSSEHPGEADKKRG
jgi:hypothetical protein